MRLPLVLLAALTLAGCPGNEADDTERARAALDVFIDQCAADQGVEASLLLTTPSLRPYFEAEGIVAGCDRILRLAGITEEPVITDEEASRAREVFAGAEILEVDTRLGVGRAVVSSGDERSTVVLEDSGEEWLVTSAELPPA